MASFNPRCKRCELWKTTPGIVCSVGDGPRDADVVVIGEAPGWAEERTGKPFQGEAGQILRAELKKNHLHSVYMTHVVKCQPPDNRSPTPDEIRSCQPYLEKELARIKPRYVMTVGVPATKVLFRGKAKINQHHGELIENVMVDYIGMPTFHPAYTLRDPSKLPGFQNDIARLGRLVRGEKRVASPDISFVRRGNLEKFIQEFIDADCFSFDLETTGLFPWDNQGAINAVGIGLPGKTWVIPGHRPKSPFQHGDSLKLLMELLVDLAKDKRAYAQNGKFDNSWLWVYCGVSFHLDFDTQMAAHTLDENTANDLNSLVREHLDEPDYDIPLAWKLFAHPLTKKKPTIVYKYCGLDCAYTLMIGKIQEDLLKQDKPVERLFYNLVMPAFRTMTEIERNGLTIDFKQMERVGLDLLQKRIRTEKRLNQLVKGKVNWNSPQQVGVILYEKLQLKSSIKTKKGMNSTSEEALIDLMGKHEVVDLLLKYREYAKFLSTYIHGLKQFMVREKLYVSYKLHGTVTGRYSSRIHSIPRDGSIRNLVTALDGWSFVQADVSQAELRIATAASGDPEMRKCFTEGIDLHWRTLLHTLGSGGVGEYVEHARKTAISSNPQMKGQSLSKVLDHLTSLGPDKAIKIWPGWKEARKKAKAINFGFIYGMYEKKFMLTAKVKYGWPATFDEAKQARDAYFTLYSGIQRWHKKQKRLAKVNMFVRHLSGRLRRLPGINSKDWSVKSEAERQAINAPVQGFIGDYKAMVMIEIHEDLDHDKLRVVGEHHDAVLMIVRDGHEEEMLPKVLQIMRHPRILKTLKIRLDIPMSGELEVGPWGAGRAYVEKKDV